MRLRRSVLTSPGITRRRCGKGFAYYEPDGSPLTDEPTARRIEALVIPPAWKKVWISPFPNGHVQALGTDAAGRRQYLYHERWRQERAEEKFDRVLELSKQLPQWRARVAEDLAGNGLSRERVLALALHLLDRGYFRAGGEQYAEQNESYGIATLLCEHVNVHGCAVAFAYPAKSGVQRQLELEDPAVAKAVRALLRRGNRAERLLVCRAATGWDDIRADDLNARFKELVGEAYSVKDLRTWHGTVLAAEAFVDADPASSKRQTKRIEAAVMGDVADALGNTPAVARGSYVDPRVVAGYEQGLTIVASARRAARESDRDAAQAILEHGTRTLINRVGKGSALSRRSNGSPMPTAA
jgi:DNA topoisomerase IB